MKKNKQDKNTEQSPEFIGTKEFSELPKTERWRWEAVPKKHERIPLFAKIVFVLSVLCLIIYIIAIINTDFADFFNSTVGVGIRFIAAKISGILPFSIAEFLLISIFPAAVGYIIYAIKKRSFTWKMVASVLSVPVSIVLLIFSMFVLTLGTGYRTPTLDTKLEFENVNVTKENLEQTAEYLVENINSLSEEMDYGTDGFAKMPYSFSDMNKKLMSAYDSFAEKYDVLTTYNSKLKPVLMSEPMSHLHTLGIYTFFTGEANININFPDYTIPYTSAHELAHQRGIAREDEANMIAFLVCMESDDAYIRYSAYLNMYEYVANALYQTSPEAYRKVNSELNAKTRAEQIAYSQFFNQYRNSGASKVSSAVNDTFLKVQGTEGEISYNLVVELTVAYLKTENIIE